MTSDDQTFIKDYLRSVIADGGDPLRALIELLGGMGGVARVLIEMREDERAIPSALTLEELGRKIIADPHAI